MRAVGLGLSVCALVVAGAAACGNNPNTPSSSGNTFTASIDGAAFSASGSSVIVTPSSVVPGTVDIIATQIANGTTTTVSVDLGFLNGTGTYPLGINQGTTPGGTLGVFVSSGSAVNNFSTPFSGAAGSVTITTLSATQIVGTFTASVPPVAPSTGATKNVTNGSFNLTMSGFAAATATNPGNTLTATLNGSAFVAGTVTASLSGSGFGIGSLTTAPNGQTISLNMIFASEAAGSFPFFSTTTTPVPVSIVSNGTPFGGSSSDSGTVTVTSVTNGVVKGTFAGFLTGGMTITNGQFTVKPH